MKFLFGSSHTGDVLVIYILYIYYMFIHIYVYTYTYTECPGGNVPDFGRMFLKLKYTDITKNTYVQS